MTQFVNDSKKLIFLEAVTRTSKAGNPYTLVTLADTEAYQQHQLFKADTCHIDGIKNGQPVKAVIDLDTVGYNQRLSLVHLEAL